MRIVIGRGNSRKVYELPAANIINRASSVERDTLIDNVCGLLGLSPVRRS